MTSGRSSTAEGIARALVQEYGRSYAEEAGIKLADQPAPLYQLLVLSTLLSARISAAVAVAAARELFAAGYRTPQAMLKASWQDRVDALGRGHYRRYDERTATMLGNGASLVRQRWHGDLRELRDEADGDVSAMAGLLTEFPGIGPAGADIFLREVQSVWPVVTPYVDSRVRATASRAGLPDQPGDLARLAGSPGQLVRLTAALIRVSRSKRVIDQLVSESARR
ncbi:MAG TPA: endonuclease [Streptosporangiaceae bacterium]|nr:endonuclease [Streptosporangiaceae bacterium]